MDDHKSNELLKTANAKVMWKKGGAEDLECFTERDYALAWRKDVDWNLEHAKRYPTVFQEFAVPYTEEQRPSRDQNQFPNEVAKLKYGNVEPLSANSVTEGRLDPVGKEEARALNKEIQTASERVNTLLTFGPIDLDRSKFLAAFCVNYCPQKDVFSVLDESKNDVYCDGHHKYVRLESTINGMPCVVMIDTGAETSIIPHWAAKKYSIRQTGPRHDIGIEGVTGKTMIPASREIITLSFAGKEYDQKVWFVWSDCMDHMGIPLLGTDVLLGNDLVLDLQTKETNKDEQR